MIKLLAAIGALTLGSATGYVVMWTVLEYDLVERYWPADDAAPVDASLPDAGVEDWELRRP